MLDSLWVAHTYWVNHCSCQCDNCSKSSAALSRGCIALCASATRLGTNHIAHTCLFTQARVPVTIPCLIIVTGLGASHKARQAAVALLAGLYVAAAKLGHHLLLLCVLQLTPPKSNCKAYDEGRGVLDENSQLLTDSLLVGCCVLMKTLQDSTCGQQPSLNVRLHGH